ncbi:hypothetical protein B1R32_1325 [Abditibacterium utsteinense]|uniref:Uncharacterized protein n=1 Tax=Abditibacterium utsteinense TaxID=1960156 RepID=A0A2S8SNW3_9BACT|nr:hypothetical protein B1R32_1325 [Abditibacterium utsteinense]
MVGALEWEQISQKGSALVILQNGISSFFVESKAGSTKNEEKPTTWSQLSRSLGQTRTIS